MSDTCQIHVRRRSCRPSPKRLRPADDRRGRGREGHPRRPAQPRVTHAQGYPYRRPQLLPDAPRRSSGLRPRGNSHIPRLDCPHRVGTGAFGNTCGGRVSARHAVRPPSRKAPLEAATILTHPEPALAESRCAAPAAALVLARSARPVRAARSAAQHHRPAHLGRSVPAADRRDVRARRRLDAAGAGASRSRPPGSWCARSSSSTTAPTGRSSPSRDWNRRVGILCGLLVYTPFHPWRYEHAVHHATAGDIEGRGKGDVETMTVAEYRAHVARSAGSATACCATRS